MKLVITFVFGILVGYFVNRPKAPESQPIQMEVSDTKGLELKSKLQILTDTEIEDYYRLKTMEERYQKADEILGKIVLLLLKDIGLRISENAKKEMNNPDRNIKLESRNTTPSVVAKSVDVEPVRSNVKKRNWVQYENRLSEIRSPMQAGEFLNEVKIDDFASEASGLSKFSNRNNNLSELSGKYVGTALVIQNSKNKNWDVDIEIHGEIRDSSLQGSSVIKISENGRVFSNSRDRGVIQSLNELSYDSQAVIIRASPNISFQVYYIKSLDSLIGNVYEKGNQNKYQRIGTLELKRP